jgi:hypothetical protein
MLCMLFYAEDGEVLCSFKTLEMIYQINIFKSQKTIIFID